jgi:nickel-dependent lactate racemase
MGAVRIPLPYGKEGVLECCLPEEALIEIVQRRPVEPAKNEYQCILDAFQNPVGARPLAETARAAKRIVVVVDDITRPTPTQKALVPLFDCLREAGVSEKQIAIVFATGSHRRQTLEEWRYLVGEEIASRCRLVDHQATAEHSLVDLGESSSGLPVILNRQTAEADLRILVGFIKPHSMAGYAGGSKSLLPGVAGLKTILALHSVKNTAHPGCRLGVIEGNPMRIALEQACKEKIGPTFILNLVVDKQKRVLFAVAGDQVAAHREAVTLFDRMGLIPVREVADIAIVACGFPSDISLYQGTNATAAPIRLAQPIVKRGGTIILVGRFYEGVGAKGFENLILDANNPLELLERIETSPEPLPDQGAAQHWIEITQNYRLLMVSEGFSSEMATRFWCTKMNSMAEGLRAAGVGNKPQPRVVVLADAPYTIAELRRE